MSFDTNQLWEDIRKNSAKLADCKLHRFPPLSLSWTKGTPLPRKLTCESCGGSMDTSQAFNYIRGYIAAGKNAEDILPDYSAKQ